LLAWSGEPQGYITLNIIISPSSQKNWGLGFEGVALEINTKVNL